MKRVRAVTGCCSVVVCLSWVPGLLRAEEVAYFVPSTVSVEVAPTEPPGAEALAQWQLVTERDGESWVVDDGAWLAVAQTVEGVAPGRYGIACRAPVGWADPPIKEIAVVGGVDIVVPVSLSTIPVFASVDEITPQTVRQGETLMFYIDEGASMSWEPHPVAVRDIHLDAGLFTYTPSADECEQFTVTFQGTSSTNTVVVTPVGVLPSEQRVIEYQGNFPYPDSAEWKSLLTVTDELSAGDVFFNYEDQPVRTVAVSAPRLVFERDEDEEGQELFEILCYAPDQPANDNIETLELYADQVIVRDPAHFPSTSVTIWARELRFEDDGAIITTPVEQLDPAASDGREGDPAGNLTLNVAAVYAEETTEPKAIEGFTHLGVNDQGYTEYQHNITGIEFVLLPGGTFPMGAQSVDAGGDNYDPSALERESPVHDVTLSPFLIARHEVTRAEYFNAWDEDDPSKFPPVAQLGTAWQSSTYAGGYASRAIDGNTDGNFGNESVTHTSPDDETPAWELRFDETFIFSRIVLWNRTDCCWDRLQNYVVSILDGGSTVYTAGPFNPWPGTSFPCPSHTIELPESVGGNVIRVELLQSSPVIPVPELSLAEVEVFGKRVSAGPEDRSSYPITNVSWNELRSTNGFLAMAGLSLPSEAQWEYAARAGTAGPYGGTGDLDEMGWYCANSGGSCADPTAGWAHPVGQKAPNDFGLYDMHGNVWEWCEDWYQETFYDDSGGLTDPICTDQASGTRVSRGGGFVHPGELARSAFRVGSDPYARRGHFGFRPALSVPDALSRRLVLVGGTGQPPKQGSDAAERSVRQFHTYWHDDMTDTAAPGEVVYVWWDCPNACCDVHGHDPQGDCCHSDIVWNSRMENGQAGGQTPLPGTAATPDGAPGKGGTGGSLHVPFELDELANLSAGYAGAIGHFREGSKADRPRNAVKLWRRSESWFCSIFWCCWDWRQWDLIDPQPNNTDGANQSPPGPVGTNPEPGAVAADVGPLAWLHPVSVRVTIDYARRAYLNGYPQRAREILEPYAAALEAAVTLPGPESWPEAWEEWTSEERADWLENYYAANPVPPGDSERIQLRNEVVSILGRIDSNLDYFGFPAGWVPMLSFEVTRELFEDEVQKAGDILYVTWVLGRAGENAVRKQAALDRLQNEMAEEYGDLQVELPVTLGELETLKLRAEALNTRIRQLGHDIQQREDYLRSKAKLTLGLKKAFSVLGTVLTKFPLGQPALGLVGSGFSAASKFNEQDALQSAIDGTNLASEFLESHIEQNAEDFSTLTSAPHPAIGVAFLASQKSLESFDTALVGINETLNAVQSWDSDLDREVQILAAEDPIHKDLVALVQDLNKDKKQFAEDMANLLNTAKSQMDRINQIELALDNLQREIVQTGETIDQEAFRYIEEMGQRQRDRLLKYQYYLVKAYQYRMLQPYDEIDDDVFNLQSVYDHFLEHSEDLIPSQTGQPILSPGSLALVFSSQLGDIKMAMVDRLQQEPRETTQEVTVELTAEQLAVLNSWDDGYLEDPPPESGYPLRINFVDLGHFGLDRDRENLRIYDLKVYQHPTDPTVGFRASPAGAQAHNVTLTIKHSGETLLDRDGEIYKFCHYRTLNDARIQWGAQYSSATGHHTNDYPSAASDSLLASLLEGGDPPLLLYSRPGLWADLELSKSTAVAPGSMEITELILSFKVDYMPTDARAELRLEALTDTGQALHPYIAVGATDKNERADGFGAFRRVYTAGQVTYLEAPRVHGSYYFDHWERGTGQTAGEAPLLENATVPGTYRAIYTRVLDGGMQLPGDTNQDGVVDLSDPIYLLDFLYTGQQSELPCGTTDSDNPTAGTLALLDWQPDGFVDLSDAVASLNWQYTSAITGQGPHHLGTECVPIAGCPDVTQCP